MYKNVNDMTPQYQTERTHIVPPYFFGGNRTGPTHPTRKTLKWYTLTLWD